jgi:hypothetical protein
VSARPRIGEVRDVEGEVIAVLYPGEAAVAIDVRDNRDGTYTVRRWRVYPAPGLGAWWRRLRYRLTHRGGER